LSWGIRGVHGLRRLVLGTAIFILSLTKQSAFDRKFYRQANFGSRLARYFPLMEFSFRGAWKWNDPSARFSNSAYAAEFAESIHFPPYLHAQLKNPSWRSKSGEATASSRTGGISQASAAGSAPSMRKIFETVWANSHADLEQYMNIAHQLTPNIHLHYKMYQNIRAPYINSGKALSQILDSIPSNARHVLAMPLLGTAGGSEKISVDLIKTLTSLYCKGEVVVIGPDSLFRPLTPENRDKYGVPIVSFNDIDPDLTLDDRIELFDRVMVETQPPVLHTVNSDIAWHAIMQRGAEYAAYSRLFGSAYSDVRTGPLRGGAFWVYIPQTIDVLSGVIADNGAVGRRAQECFGLSSRQAGKFVVVPSAFETDGIDLSRPIATKATGRSLWLSRIAYEKRIDILAAIAQKRPDRKFDMYGAIVKGAHQVPDLTWMDSAPNVTMRGKFNSLHDVCVADYDSYIFTTSAEGLPVVLLEMTALGLPIIAPDVGGVGEFLDSNTGWLVSGPDAVDEYISAIAEIEARPDLVAQKVSAARQRLQTRHSFLNFSGCVSAIPDYIRRGE